MDGEARPDYPCDTCRHLSPLYECSKGLEKYQPTCIGYEIISDAEIERREAGIRAGELFVEAIGNHALKD